MSNAALQFNERRSPAASQKRGAVTAAAGVGQSRWSELGSALFFIAVIFVLYLGWQDRNSLRLTAESGMGYALGIIGGVLMLLLLLYPARKRLAIMRRFGPIKWWFRTHMILGIVGPVTILYHCNFKLGALNSNVSLLCMILVASSGLIGRYFYSKLHYGLYGRRATAQELRQDIELLKDQSSSTLPAASRLAMKLHALEVTALASQDKIMRNPLRIVIYNLRSYWMSINLGRLLKAALYKQIASDRAHLSIKQLEEERRRLAVYLEMLRKINQLTYYERLFSLWHVLHFPLFLMLVMSGIIHVIAVHIY